jgi:cell division inhibitor SulA
MYRNFDNVRQDDLVLSAENNASMLKTICSAAVGAVSTSERKYTLMQLIRQHQFQSGWILLIAPSQVPAKEWAEHYQLSLHNVLVIHQKQITDLPGTVKQALASPSCKVVINFGDQLEQDELEQCRNLAIRNNIWFYQYEQMRQELITH